MSITSCQGLLIRELIPLSTDKWLTNNWPMTDQYCAISYQFFWLESLFLVILDCKSILVLLIYWFYEIFPSISIFNHVFILFFRCCCNKYVTGVTHTLMQSFHQTQGPIKHLTQGGIVDLLNKSEPSQACLDSCPRAIITSNMRTHQTSNMRRHHTSNTRTHHWPYE